MSISGTTMSISTLTVGGVNIKTTLNELTTTRKFTFTPPDRSTAIIIDLQNCEMSYIDNPAYSLVMVDADDKLIFGIFG